MAQRPRFNPDLHRDALARIRASADRLAEIERQAAAERKVRDNEILELLRLDVPPTHAQIAEAAHLTRGGISAYAKRAWSGLEMAEDDA